MDRYPIDRPRRTFTIADAVDELLDAFGVDQAGKHLSWAKTVLRDAMSIFAGERTWSYWLRNWSVTTSPPFSTGTVGYVAATGVLTLTGGTWPADILYRQFYLGNEFYEVDRILSSSTLVLRNGPVDDLASGQTFKAVRLEYPVPVNARRITQLQSSTGTVGVQYIAPVDLLSLRTRQSAASIPTWFTIRGDSRVAGRMAFEFGPPPSASRRYEFLYYASPGEQAYQSYGRDVRYQTGLVSWSAAGSTITIDGGEFRSSMVGSIIRFSADNAPPTGEAGENPFVLERTITAVSAPGTLTVDSPISDASADDGVGFSISDPLDFAPELWAAFMRCAEFEYSKRVRDAKDQAAREKFYVNELARAFAADQTWSPADMGSWVWLPLENVSVPR